MIEKIDRGVFALPLPAAYPGYVACEAADIEGIVMVETGYAMLPNEILWAAEEEVLYSKLVKAGLVIEELNILPYAEWYELMRKKGWE